MEPSTVVAIVLGIATIFTLGVLNTIIYLASLLAMVTYVWPHVEAFGIANDISTQSLALGMLLGWVLAVVRTMKERRLAAMIKKS